MHLQNATVAEVRDGRLLVIDGGLLECVADDRRMRNTMPSCCWSCELPEQAGMKASDACCPSFGGHMLATSPDLGATTKE